MQPRRKKWTMGACVMVFALVAGGLFFVPRCRPSGGLADRAPSEPAKAIRNSGDNSPGQPGTSGAYRGEIEELDAIPGGPGVIECTRAWARAALERDPEGTWNALQADQAQFLNRAVCAHYLAEWMAIDPDSAMAALPAYADRLKGDLTTVRTAVIGMANAADPQVRAQIWAELLNDEGSNLNAALLSGFFRSFLRDDAVAGAKRLEEIPSARRFLDDRDACVHQLARNDPNALIDWIRELPEVDDRWLGDRRRSIAGGLAGYLKQTNDLSTILRVLKDLPERVRPEAVRQLAEVHPEDDGIESVERWRAVLPDLETEGSHALSAEIFSTHVKRGSGRLVRQLDMASLHPAERDAVATAYASVAPKAALDWSRSLPSGSDKQRITDQIITTWLRSEPVTATRATLALPPGPQRKHTLAVVETATANLDDPRVRKTVRELLENRETTP